MRKLIQIILGMSGPKAVAIGMSFLIILLIAIPLLVIWSLNTLFIPNFGIEYSFQTWFAALLLIAIFRG